MDEAIWILIIDDSEDDRLLYRRSLKKVTDRNYSVSEASDGEDGFRQLEEKQPACVLLDYSLPGYNGIEVLKRIRGKHPFIPVVMLTGQGNENVAVSAMQEGAQNYISKSAITPEILDHVVWMAMEHCIMQKRIYEQRTSLEVFTHALAHDLKEPIRTIRSFVELLALNESFSGKAKGHFKHIQDAADRMHMLIDTVFHYTRLDDPAQVARETCDAGAVLNGVKENLGKLIEENGVVISSDVPLPRVYANRPQLMQVLQNLISNAINHGGKAIEIHVSAREQGDHWLFGVRDNGPGIEEAYFQKIFEPFKRLSHRESKGAGLGLATCKKIVESHGGRIWCESKPGMGTTFFFTLSKAPAQSDGGPPAERKPAPASAAGGGSGKSLANMMLVDDSHADVEITQHRLIDSPKLRCNFFVAANGEEALDLLNDKAKQGEKMDLMLVDINMPEMDGFELLERIRADKTLRQIPVVMCTGSTYDKDMQRAKELGAIGYLTKPVAFEVLKTIIDENSAVQICRDNSGYNLLCAA